MSNFNDTLKPLRYALGFLCFRINFMQPKIYQIYGQEQDLRAAHICIKTNFLKRTRLRVCEWISKFITHTDCCDFTK